MVEHTSGQIFVSILENNIPAASAWILGSAAHPNLCGLVQFYDTPMGGTLVTAEIYGLPNRDTDDGTHFYAMHIHERGNCTPPFDQTGNHYNPNGTTHPQHAGDLPPLLGNNGSAWMAFYTDRFVPGDVLGQSVVIHAMRDDFTSQPAGDSGDKIGCGVILAE